MKKMIILSAIILFGAPAYAVVGCVPLQSTTTCTSTPSTYKNKGEWGATCDGVNVRGIAVCVSSASSVIGGATSAPTVSVTLANNKYCKCKMTQPVVSRWITPASCTDNLCYTSMSSMTPEDCKTYCGYMCAGTISTGLYPDAEISFRNAIFYSMTD